MNETLKTLLERRSVRSYKEEQVPEEILRQILEAGEYAPSGMGLQSAVMVVVRDKDTIEQMSRMNAAVMGGGGDPFYGALRLLWCLETAPGEPTWRTGALLWGI